MSKRLFRNAGLIWILAIWMRAYPDFVSDQNIRILCACVGGAYSAFLAIYFEVNK